MLGYKNMRIILAILLLLAFNTVIGAEGSQKPDYTGFWKNNCEDPFGIQIVHYQNGMYTTRFCGPGGGCDAPPDIQQLTLIDGDPQYEVISPIEIHEKTGDTVYSVLHKCTTETNPILKYSDDDIAEGKRNMIIVVGIHIAYLIIAIFIYVRLLKQILNGKGLRLRIKKSAVFAVLFSPGIAWAWPFASPTFASLAFLFSFLPALMVYPQYSYIPLGMSLIPMIACAIIVFAVLTVKDHVNEK